MKRLVLFIIITTVTVNLTAFAGGLTTVNGTGTLNTSRGINLNNPLIEAVGGQSFDQDSGYVFGVETSITQMTYNGKNSQSNLGLSPYLSYYRKIDDDSILSFKLDTPYGSRSSFNNNPQQLGYNTKTLLSGTYSTVELNRQITDELSIGLGGILCWMQFDYTAPFDVKRVPLPILTESEADGFGFGWTAKLFYQPSPKLALALSYTSEIKAKLGGMTKISLGPFRIHDQFDSEFTFPSKLELGLALKLNEKWVVTGDVGFGGYSKTPNDMTIKFHDLPLTKSNTLAWQDIWYTHLASTHQVGKNGEWQIRYGAGYMSCAIPDKTMSTLTMDVPGWDVTAGIGWQGKRVSIDANYIFGWGENKVRKGLFAGDYGAKIHTFSVTVSW